MRVVIHGDDFTILGYDKDLDWFREQIMAKWQIKVKGRIGPSEADLKSIHILNRIVEWKDDGIHYEADPRNAEIILKALNIKNDSKGTSVPGSREETDLTGEESPLLRPHMATQYRAIVARAICLAQDRPDICLTAKELSRSIANPTVLAMTKLKRLGRCLQDHRRYVNIFRDQSYTSG